MATARKTIPARFKKLRHWKQRFNKNAKFVWRRSLNFGGKRTKIGATVPQSLMDKPTKLRRFWEANVIELRDFEAKNVLTGKAESNAPKKAEPEAVGVDKKAVAAAKRAKKKAAKLAKNKADKNKGGDPVPKESTNDEAT